MLVYLALIPLIIASCIGSYLSVKLRAGAVAWGWCFLPTVVTASIWIYFAKSKMRLPTAACLFDVAAAVSYLAVMLMMGEKLTAWQACGAALSVAGVALMSWS